jgi:hypothetical protein
MILFLKLILWPATVFFWTAWLVCIYVMLTVRMSETQAQKTLARFLIWTVLGFTTSAGLVAIYFN